MTSPRSRKLLRWLLGLLIGLAVLFIVAVFAVQRLIDVPRVRTDLSKKLSQAVNGQVTWEDLDIRLLPLPHGVVKGAHFSIPHIVTVDAATAEVTLRLLPLFSGHAELSTVTVLQPTVDVWIAKSTATNESATTTNALALYQKAMRPVMDIIARFAPHTTLAINQGRIAVHAFNLPPFVASDLNLRVVTDGTRVAVNASAQGTYWDNLTLEGQIEFATLRAVAKLDAIGLKPQPVLDALLTTTRETLVLSSAGVRLEAHTDGKTDIDIALDLDLPRAELHRRGKRLDIVEVRVGGTVKLSNQTVEIALDKIHLGDLVPIAQANLLLTGPNHEPTIRIGIEALDLARLRDAAVTLAGDQPVVRQTISRIRGGRLLDLKLNTQAATFAELFSWSRLHASAALKGGEMLLPTVERNVTQVVAQVELVDGTVKITKLNAQLGASQLRQASADIVLLEPLRLTGTQAQATLVLDDLLPRLRERPAFAQALQSVPDLTGIADVSVRNIALRFDRPAQIVYDLAVQPRRVRVQTKQLPAPLDIRGGSARITPRAISLTRIGAQLFDSKATISGEVTDFSNQHPHVIAHVTDGVADQQLVDWLWQRAAIAQRFKPITPIQLSAQRVQWSEAGLDIQANAKFDTGPALSIDLFMHDKSFLLRRATLKDRDSDAVFTFAKRDSLIEAGFAGVFAGQSLAALFGHAAELHAGRISGDFQLTLNLDQQRRSTAHGKLFGEQIDLNNIFALPIKLEHVDLQADDEAVHVRDLRIDWAEQKATLRGDIARQGDGFALALEVATQSFVLDALRSPSSEPTAKQATATTQTNDTTFDPWSLPITGTVVLRADSLEYKHRRAEGVRALITLQEESATLAVTDASLCGMSMPLTLHATPQEYNASVQLAAKNQSLSGFTQCLEGKQISVSGQFDLAAALSTKGKTDKLNQSLIQNLSGAIEFHAYDGEIRKLALLGNILSLKSVSDLVKGQVNLKEAGFKYRDITVRSKVRDGTVKLEQAALDSAALGIATTGTINLDNYESQLTVLVAPFGRLDRIMRNVPIVGYIMGGAMTSIPVGVSGDIRNPIVVPLGPSAVGAELLGIFERTFKLPGKLVEPLSTTPTK